MTIARFAPSPTGHLHIGNLRTALLNHLVCRKSDGSFILRLDDTDPQRSKPEYADSIMEDLEWLGLYWDQLERQSLRKQNYFDAAGKLRSAGVLYECFETPEELEFKRKLQLKAGKPPVYDRTSLSLTTDERDSLRKERAGYWRFKLDQERIEWTDLIQGQVSIDATSLSDPVLIRADGQVLYTLASVVDDVEMSVTDVVRGSDHITNTATQIQIMKRLGAAPPRFAHHSLLTGPEGEPLAKRLGALSIRDMRQSGLEPMVLLSLLAYLGTSAPVQARNSLGELIDDFEIGRFSTAPTKFDAQDLIPLNSKLLAMRPYSAAEDRIRSLGVPDDIAERFWMTTRTNISKLDDLADWWAVFSGAIDPEIDEEDRDFVELAKSLLPDPPFDERTWSTWTSAVSEKTGRKGKALYFPLRRALTGRSSGPEMASVMPLLQDVRRTGIQ